MTAGGEGRTKMKKPQPRKLKKPDPNQRRSEMKATLCFLVDRMTEEQLRRMEKWTFQRWVDALLNLPSGGHSLRQRK